MTTEKLPEHLHAAYDWIDAGGEIDKLRAMDDATARTYADECAANSRDNGDGDVSSDDVYALWLHLTP